MKKSVIGIIFLVYAVTSVAAQNSNFQQEFAYGINGGVTLSSMRFVPYISQEKLIQGQGGITARYISEKNFGLQIELNYSLRGWKEQADEVRLNKYSRTTSYLELPLLTHIYFNMGKRFRGIFNLGPQIGYYLSEKTLERALYAPSPTIHFHDDNSFTFIYNRPDIIFKGNPPYYFQNIQRKFDYGITGGGGIELRTGIGSFILEGRYYFGLSDVFNNSRADYFQASSNQIISIKLTYLTNYFNK